MAAAWEREVARALRGAAALLEPPWLATGPAALTTLDRLDPSVLWDELLRATLADRAPTDGGSELAAPGAGAMPRSGSPAARDNARGPAPWKDAAQTTARRNGTSTPEPPPAFARTQAETSDGPAPAAGTTARVYPIAAPQIDAQPAPAGTPQAVSQPATRLVSDLSDLRTFFSTVVADSQSPAGDAAGAPSPTDPPCRPRGERAMAIAGRAPVRPGTALTVEERGAAEPAPNGARQQASTVTSPSGASDFTAGAPADAAAPTGAGVAEQTSDDRARGRGIDRVRGAARSIERPAPPPTLAPPPWESTTAADPIEPPPPTARHQQAGGAPTGTAALPDPAWEAVLFDRLLDRLQNHLREQAIRQLGFTGGLP